MVVLAVSHRAHEFSGLCAELFFTALFGSLFSPEPHQPVTGGQTRLELSVHSFDLVCSVVTRQFADARRPIKQ
jgi:hypothetical protein